MFSYLHLFIRITLDQHTVIFHPDDGNSLWSVTIYPAIFYTPHIAPRINFFIQMSISKHHSPLKQPDYSTKTRQTWNICAKS